MNKCAVLKGVCVQVTLGFPMYGRHVSGGWATETNCGSMEFEIDAFAGNLYLFFEYWTPFSWKRKSIGILDWNGLYRGWQLYPANESPTFPACSVCQWRSSCTPFGWPLHVSGCSAIADRLDGVPFCVWAL
jgi:hypothetical protein